MLTTSQIFLNVSYAIDDFIDFFGFDDIIQNCRQKLIESHGTSSVNIRRKLTVWQDLTVIMNKKKK